MPSEGKPWKIYSSKEKTRLVYSCTFCLSHIGKRLFFSEYPGIFHLLPQIHSTPTLLPSPHWAVPGPVWTVASGSLARWFLLGSANGVYWQERCEGRRRVKPGCIFSQRPLCDCVPLRKVTAPRSVPLHTAFSVWAQKVLLSLARTSLAFTSLFLQHLVTSLCPAHSLVNHPLILLSSNPQIQFSCPDLSFPC